MIGQLRFETLACFGEKGGMVRCEAANVALVRFNRPLTDLEWRAFAETCDHFASCDTHPKDGDVKQAPLVSGAVPHEDAGDAQNKST